MHQQAYQIVHANIAVPRAPLDDPIMAGFVTQVDEINALAYSAPGFVAQSEPPDAGEVFPEGILVNMSVWRSVADLERFTHHGLHALALDRRAGWFEQSSDAGYVLYWVPAGHAPSEREVKRRIDHLKEYGPTPYAFSFGHRFTIDDMLAYTGAKDA